MSDATRNPTKHAGPSTPRALSGETLAGAPRDRGELLPALQVTGGSRVEEALILANRLHWSQTRKSTTIPYMGHLLGVASLVIEDGGSEDEVIAALLHDAVEDQGGAATLAAIWPRFGDAVADIVDACSDTDQQPKPPWLARKQRYVEHLRSAGAQVLRVSCADKAHNARAILADHDALGDGVFRRFSAPRNLTLAYYSELATVFDERLPGGVARDLRRTVDALLMATEAPTPIELTALFWDPAPA